MQYQTRHLEAIREISHGSAFHRPGAKFQASAIDADYYIENGDAREVKEEAATAPKQQKPAPKAEPVEQAPGAPVAAPAASQLRQPSTPAQVRAAVTTPQRRSFGQAPSQAASSTEPMKVADLPGPGAGSKTPDAS